MAKIENPIQCSTTGRVGAVVNYQFRGRWCVRTVPAAVHNPRTVRQQEGRSLFVQSVRLASQMMCVLRVGLRAPALAMHKTESNLFMQLNKGCFSLVDGLLEVDYASLRVAMGEVVAVAFGVPRLEEPLLVAADFVGNPNHLSCSSDDGVHLAAFCPARQLALLSAPAVRRASCVTLRLPEEWTGNEVQLYGLTRDWGGHASDSTYLGALQL